MKQTVTIIDAGPAHQGLQSIIVETEKKRRGVRFLPRQALKRVYRSASKAVVNPFDMN